MKDRRPVSATYRFQFTKNFPFANAEALVPYLKQLGISHIYASPIFAAQPGSESGYDTCDYAVINPELGGEEAFVSLVRTLHAQGMGIIVDFVPNHMSADSRCNQWWRSVLANGPSSTVSEYFDIDWYPVKPELQGKVLLAILGKQYGEVLESGELRVQYCSGEFCLLYAEKNLPLNPRQIQVLLRHRLGDLTASDEIDPDILLEYESILFHLDHIPDYRQVAPEARADRERETAIAAHRLGGVIGKSAALRQHLDLVLRDFNGMPGRPESFDLLHTLLEEQPYRLSYWRTALEEINYRRFFDINDLIGVRMEFAPLFQAAHAKLIELARNGWIDGVRIDHIDGLLDPQQYLLQLRQVTANLPKSLYLIVEKILARQEWLNADWPVDGTSGYEYLALINGLWVQEQNLPEIERIYRRFQGRLHADEDVVYRAKRLITSTSMASELNVLAHELNRLSEQNRRSRDFTLNGLQEALREVVACFPVYRTYVSELGFNSSDEVAVNEAIGQAQRRNPTIDFSIFEFIRGHLCPVRQPEDTDDAFAQRLRFAMKFQQYTSPVQAKGIEDTVFYRYCPVASLNEVGSGTGRRTTNPPEFHHANIERLNRWPDGMITTSTHDTKRGEDARMRIHVLTEMPDEWRARLLEWSGINEIAKTMVNGQFAPDRSDEYLYYQTLLGVWPPGQQESGDSLDNVVDRMQKFMNKALKEAKVHTSWINPSNEYDSAMHNFVEQTLRGASSKSFLRSFLPLAARVAALGAWGSLSQVALKFASPGVPDIYQGGELWDLNLVDPDNRRAVNFAERQQRIERLHGDLPEADTGAEHNKLEVAKLCANWQTGDIKLFYIAAGLHMREREPRLLSRGTYIPLEIEGPYADHLVAFAREWGGRMIVTIAARWFASLLAAPDALDQLSRRLQTTIIELPAQRRQTELRNVLNGAVTTCRSEGGVIHLSAGEALGSLPAVWLVTND